MADQERISIREYARRKGVSDTAIHKSIRAGKIVKGLDKTNPKRPTIIPSIADEEMAANHNPTYERTVLSGKSSASVMAPKEPESVPDAGGNATLAAAKRAKAVYDAKITELTFKEKSGILVRKDEVYRALFAYGQSIRAAIQAVPDRVIDEVISCGTRNEAHLVLQRALDDALLKLAESENLQFATR